MSRKCLIVLGMHRSGTSALTGVLNILGVELGSTLIAPDKNNTKGYFENLAINRLNENILKSLNSRWDDPLPYKDGWWEQDEIYNRFKPEISGIIDSNFQQEVFCIKDPRLCRLLPLWNKVLVEKGIEVSCVIPVRNPLEVAGSWEKSFATERSLLIWLTNTLDAELYSRDKPRIITTFSGLLSDPELTVSKILSHLGLTLPREFDEARTEIAQFLEGGLRHHELSLDGLDIDSTGLTKRTYALLACHEFSACKDAETLGTIDDIRRSYDRQLDFFSALTHHIADENKGMQTELKAARQGMNESEAHVADLEAALKGRIEHIAWLEDGMIAPLEGLVKKAYANIGELQIKVKKLGQKLSAIMPSLEKMLLRLEAEPASAGLLLDAGEFCFAFNLTKMARSFFERALTLEPHNVNAMNNLGVLNFQTGELRSARRYFMKALSIDSTQRESMYNLAMIEQAEQGQILAQPEADTEVEAALEEAESLIQYITVKANRVRALPPKILKRNHFVPMSHPNIPQSDLKLIAFYLPQFHPIPENDGWWGKGFTEWTNVTRAVQQFEGHYQPHLPGELGFYDLRVPEVQERQVELARQYGIAGFCFHFYWFAGKLLLEKPIEQYLANSKIDFPFCINWANENWSRRWDGLDKDILIAQQHSPEDDIAFIEHVSRYMKDPRYIRVDSKPLLMVYRPELLPDPKATAQRWRRWCLDNGMGEIYLVLTHSFGHTDPRALEFDAAVEFAPNTFPVRSAREQVRLLNKDFSGHIFDYNSAVDIAKNYVAPPYRKFRGICPGWDNEARKPGKGVTFINSTPEAYGDWLRIICEYTEEHFAPDERLVFINAWNEWAEGAHLEPDREFGYAFLNSTAEVLASLQWASGIVKKHDTAVILHLYYIDLWPEISGYLKNLEGDFDLFVSIPVDEDFPEASLFELHKDTYIYRCPNRGRDVAPFLYIMQNIFPLQYEYILKIHTKRSMHRQDGDVWRGDLFRKLVGTPKTVKKIKKTFDKDAGVAIIAAEGHVVHSSFYWGANEANVKSLASMANIPYSDEFFSFVAGTMFWFRPSAFKEVVDLRRTLSDFELEEGQLDGTLAHALERFFGLLVFHKRMDILESNGKGNFKKIEVDDAKEKYKYC